MSATLVPRCFPKPGPTALRSLCPPASSQPGVSGQVTESLVSGLRRPPLSPGHLPSSQPYMFPRAVPCLRKNLPGASALIQILPSSLLNGQLSLEEASLTARAQNGPLSDLQEVNPPSPPLTHTHLVRWSAEKRQHSEQAGVICEHLVHRWMSVRCL